MSRDLLNQLHTLDGPRYAWVITKDHLDNSSTESLTGDVGIIGPMDAFLDSKTDITKHPDAKKFRMYDDDGELYYTGYIVVEGEPATEFGEECFNPLNDFGTPNAGAVRIAYLNPTTGKWETL
jgi:hypothetical protein